MEKVVNNQMVSQSAVTMMLIQMLICLALPIGLAVWVIKRRSHPQKGRLKSSSSGWESSSYLPVY